jgi:prephenate dehydratase
MALPGTQLDEISSVHSHVHALGQCRRFIRDHGLTPVVAGDTAGAAREVAEAGDRSRAAISPPLAAGIYGLDVLIDDIEDEEHNTTRFVVLSRDFVQAPAGNGPVVTSFVFNVRNLPAALYKALGGFATNGINMTKLESYMVGGRFAATQFLAEVDGHPDDLGLKRALEELRFFTTEVKILGVYPADAFRA